MSKSMVGAAGGGKVTVEGLSADVVLAGTTVTVKQGKKVLSNVNGGLDVLLFGGTVNGGYAYYWDGSDYKTYVLTTGSPSPLIFSGTPKVAIAAGSAYGVVINLCGYDIPRDGKVYSYTEDLTNALTVSNPANVYGGFAVLGVK